MKFWGVVLNGAQSQVEHENKNTVNCRLESKPPPPVMGQLPAGEIVLKKKNGREETDSLKS